MLDPLSDILLQDSYISLKKQLSRIFLPPAKKRQVSGCGGFVARKGRLPKNECILFRFTVQKHMMLFFSSGISSLEAAGKGTSSTKRLSFWEEEERLEGVKGLWISWLTKRSDVFDFESIF